MPESERVQYRVIGKPTPYVDARDKVTGRVTYGADFRLPGMLWGKILRSPYAHARIVSVDASRAGKIPGMKAVLLGADVSQHKIGHAVKDQDVLCRDRVRYLGDPIALVPAEDGEAAEEATAAITVEFEELPAVFDVEEAIRGDAPRVHDDPSLYEPGALSRIIPVRPVPRSNVASHVVVQKGDVATAFRHAHASFEAFKTRVITVRTAVDKDGRILGRSATVKWDTGAYAEGLPPIISALSCGAGPYEIPNVQIEVFLVYTNTVPGTSYRGVGMPDLTFAIESHTDIIARKMGIDPLDFRLKNIVEDGSETVLGTKLQSVGLRECLEKARDELGWEQPVSGKGKSIVCIQKFSSPMSSSSAHVLINEDGTVTLSTGAVEIGQGCKTALAQICAEVLGVRLEDIEVVMSDTGATPFDQGAFSSRLTYHAGNAVRLAASDARQQMLRLAASELGVPEGDLDIRDGRILSVRESCPGMPLARLARKGPIQGVGSFTGGLDIVSLLERTPRPPELEVEDDYHLPTFADSPSVIPLIVEHPTRHGPFGARGVGELAILGVGAAIANALDNLTGARIKTTPFTPEKVLRTLLETHGR
jgi:CO/xanthine dehydrogenase Mo-binding subunit